MVAVLLTGMSGVGKSTVLAELARRGHATLDTDIGPWTETAPWGRDGEPERLWREGPVAAVLDGHRDGLLVVAGTVANQGRLYARFAAVVLLTAPLDVLLARVASRTTNDFGKDRSERERIVRDVREVEPLLRASASHEVETDAPLAEVVGAVLRAAGQPSAVTE